jgi:hypothetical protein
MLILWSAIELNVAVSTPVRKSQLLEIPKQQLYSQIITTCMPTLAPLFRYFTDQTKRSRSENIRLDSGSGSKSKTARSSHNHSLNFGASHTRVFATETKITSETKMPPHSDNDSQELIMQSNNVEDNYLIKETEYSVQVTTGADQGDLPIHFPPNETKTPGLAR